MQHNYQHPSSYQCKAQDKNELYLIQTQYTPSDKTSAFLISKSSKHAGPIAIKSLFQSF